MTESEWLTTDESLAMTFDLFERKAKIERLPAFVASFSESQRLLSLLSGETRSIFEAYAKWVYAGGRHPSELYPTLRSRPLGQGIDTWEAGETIEILSARPGNGSWIFLGPMLMAEAFGRRQGSSLEPMTEESRPYYRQQADRLREIVGNPFRPVTFRAEWRTEAAVGIAAKMYDSREFGNMPVLADALQDAGCEHPDILAHCRDGGTHVRGCWVVDLVLGKA